MNRSDLKDKIKAIIRQTYQHDIVDEVPEVEEVTLDADPFPVLNKFPELREVIIKLLTDQYHYFIDEIMWVAPKPSTFRIVFINNQYFFLTLTDRTWIAQIEGKKYYLINMKEEQGALKAITRILRYGGGNSLEEPEIVDKEDDDSGPEPDEPESDEPEKIEEPNEE